MNSLRFVFFAVSASVAVHGCAVGTDTGPDIQFLATSGSEALSTAPTVPDAQQTGFTIESVRANVRDIELELESGVGCDDFDDLDARAQCDSEGDRGVIVLAGPFLVDLFNGTSTPALDDLRLPALTYRRIDVRFDDADPDDGIVNPNDPLAENTFRATGTFSYDGAPRQFEITLAFSEDARFENASGIALEEGTAEDLIVQLDAREWLRALPLTQCLDDGDLTLEGNRLRVSDGSGGCSDIENTLKDAIRGSGSLTTR